MNPDPKPEKTEKKKPKPLKRTPLKRVPFKRKPYTKKKPKAKKKKNPIKRLKNELWELCKEYCRLRWGNTCYTCGKPNLVGSNWHTGHAIPSCLCPFELDYSPDNLRPQCYFCNIHAGGNGAIFMDKLRMMHGEEYVANLFLMKNQPRITKPSIEDYERLIAEYKTRISELKP